MTNDMTHSKLLEKYERHSKRFMMQIQMFFDRCALRCNPMILMQRNGRTKS